MVNAWASEQAWYWGNLKTSEKSNEITAIPALLDMLEVRSSHMPWVAKRAYRIKRCGLFVGCHNHETHEDIKLFLDHLACQEKLPESASYHETIDKGHGRIEVRRCWVSTDVDWLEQRSEWKDLNMIGVVEGERHEGEKVSIERRYFISSLTTSAATFMSAVRAHWSVENNLHWSLDISFREDGCRIRKGYGSENMAVFRQIALNLLSQEKTEKLGMMNKRITAAADDEYLELLLQGVI